MCHKSSVTEKKETNELLDKGNLNFKNKTML